MKILLVNKFHYRKGGSETYYFSLAELLRSAGAEVLFFAMADEHNEPCAQSEYFVPGVDYNTGGGALQRLRDAKNLLYNKEAARRFAALLDAEQPDVVHLNLVHRQITLSVVDECAKRGVPVVFTQHDLICVCPNYTCLSPDGVCEACLDGNFGPCVRKKCVKHSRAKSLLAAAEAVRYRQRGSYNKIDAYITPSAFYAELLRGCNFTRAPILHHANFLPLGTAYGVQPGAGEYLLYLGRLTPEKGVASLLHALALCPGASLHLAGDGPQRQPLEALARELGLEERVKFRGFLQGEALQAELAGCRAVVLPSLWYENGPYSAMEALAAGRPVLAAEIGGLPELVQSGKTGFLFPPGDAEALAGCIRQLAQLPAAEYTALQKAAADFAAETFAAETYRDWVLNVYDTLLEKKAKRAAR